MAEASRYITKHYSLVLGIKQGSAAAEKPVDELKTLLKVSKNNKLWVDDNYPTSVEKNFMINFVKAANKFDDIVVSFHNGKCDDNVQFQGVHWHVAAFCNVHPSRDSRWGRRLLDISNSSGQTYFACQAVRVVCALVRHIAKAPRQVILKKGQYISLLDTMPEDPKAVAETESMDGSTDGTPDWSQARLKQGVEYARITNLVKLMKKYNQSEVNQLKNIVSLKRDDWPRLLELMCAPSWDTVSRKASEIFKTEESRKTLDERMTEAEDIFPGETDKWMSAKESQETFEKWCQDNNIEVIEFINALFDVLTRKRPKVNTFMLEGPTCAGKSWVVRSLQYFYPFHGEVHGAGGYNFAYQSCIDQAIIFMEEPMLEPTTVDHAKMVLEGADTLVNVKCKPPAMLKGTPVIITSNHPIHKWVPSEQETLRSRMFHFDTTTQSWLKDIKKTLHPKMWVNYYDFYKKAQETVATAEREKAPKRAAATTRLTDSAKKVKRALFDDAMMQPGQGALVELHEIYGSDSDEELCNALNEIEKSVE